MQFTRKLTHPARRRISDLWNTYGDALFCLERYEESRDAFHKALQADPQDVRARFNLADYFNQIKDFPQALQVIAEGLLNDKRGEYRERLLQKQAEILRRIVQREEMEMRFLAGRVNRRINPTQPGNLSSVNEAANRLGETGLPASW